METFIISNRKTNFLSKISSADDEKILKNIMPADHLCALDKLQNPETW
ncbi:hypothetical protein SAMN05421766_10716 [Zobellia uliginosa]|uniref:Uncharacterized protein n=1 Tax=Zobellia uliginosa TaxID=143224 RepID=A0ABY1L0D8_9FLAO|nr:hypothetical protein [Zobellia uliginosa]SIT01374.1 hypothetical protein SAMN05421766_10716 [Zobellia uliginosa]